MAEEPPTHQDEGNFLTPDLSISGNFRQLWFLWQKSPPPMREIFLTPDLSISGNFEKLWFWWQKSPPPDEGKNFWHQIYPFQAILSNFGFCGRRAPHPPGWGKFFWHQIYPFQAISGNFCFCGRKAPPPTPRMREKFLTPDLSISGNFERLWFLWQKSPPLGWGKFFDTRSIHLRQFWATLVFVAEKPPPPPRMREIFWHQIYPFQAILSNFGFCGRKAHPPDEGKFLTPALSISGNFEWLWFLWQKSPPSRMRENSLTPDLSISGNLKQPWFFVAEKPLPPEGKFFDTRSIHFRQFWATLVFVAVEPLPQWGWGKIFWHQIYPFQAILSDFGFCGRKAPPPQWGKFFWHQIYPFQAILRNFGFGGRKAPPRWGEKILTPDLSISGNFKQLWFLWQKSPPPPRMREIFLTPDLSISGNFRQLWFLWQKSPPPYSKDEGKFFDTRSIHFRQFRVTLVFVAEKPPPWDGGNFIDTRSIHLRQFWATLVFVAEKPPLQDEGKFFDTRSIHFRQFEATLVFVAEKPLPPKGKFFDTRSIHFRQFWATLVFVAVEPLPQWGWGKIFWHQIYPFQAFWATLVFVAEKPPPMREIFLTPDLSISGNFEKLWFWWQKSPPPRWGEKILTPDLSISGNFKQLWFLWQKSPPPPRMREIFLTPDLSISGNFRQLWFLWQKSPPPLLQGWGKIFWHQIYPFQAISSDFGFCSRKAPPPWDGGNFIDTRSIHLRQFWATLVFVAEKSPLQDEGKFLTPDLSISGNFKQLWFLWQKSPSPPGWGKNFLTSDLSISGNFK